jgi:hypothetical protein
LTASIQYLDDLGSVVALVVYSAPQNLVFLLTIIKIHSAFISVLSQCPVERFMIVDVSFLHAFDEFPDLLYIYFVVQT